MRIIKESILFLGVVAFAVGTTQGLVASKSGNIDDKSKKLMLLYAGYLRNEEGILQLPPEIVELVKGYLTYLDLRQYLTHDKVIKGLELKKYPKFNKDHFYTAHSNLDTNPQCEEDDECPFQHLWCRISQECDRGNAEKMIKFLSLFLGNSWPLSAKKISPRRLRAGHRLTYPGLVSAMSDFNTSFLKGVLSKAGDQSDHKDAYAMPFEEIFGKEIEEIKAAICKYEKKRDPWNKGRGYIVETALIYFYLFDKYTDHQGQIKL